MQLLGVDMRPKRQDGHAPSDEAPETVRRPGGVEFDHREVAVHIVAHHLGARGRADGAELSAEQQVAGDEEDVELAQGAVGREMVQR